MRGDLPDEFEVTVALKTLKKNNQQEWSEDQSTEI